MWTLPHPRGRRRLGVVAAHRRHQDRGGPGCRARLRDGRRAPGAVGLRDLRPGAHGAAGSQAHPRGTHEGRARRAPGIRHRRRAPDLARDPERVLAAARRARGRRRRRLVRVLPALGGREEGRATAPGSPARSAPPRSACPASRRWGSTSSTCRRSTRSGASSARDRTTRTTARPGDPGSPWAIGSAEGGHDAIHPDLGTVADFAYFVKEAEAAGLEVALDLALQCAPDHPVGDRASRLVHAAGPTARIAYAENPPKKYQDIYPLNFDNDPEGIRAEVLRIVELWISRGVKIFRVDNPHTKPLDFWEWLLADVNGRHPDVVFLAEAFTRPAMLHSLAGAGFQQSYSYFTWRNTKTRARGVLHRDLAGPDADYLHPNLFVNTPDILTEFLQFGGRPAYKLRAALAATASPLWGVYAGYELFEDVARPGSEENIDNEKYEYKQRDWEKAEARGRLARALPDACSTASGPRTRRSGSCATCACTGATTSRSSCTRSTSTATSRESGTPDGADRRRQRRPALGARVDRAPRPDRARPRAGRDVQRARPDLGGQLDLDAIPTTCASTRSPSRCTSSRSTTGRCRDG